MTGEEENKKSDLRITLPSPCSIKSKSFCVIRHIPRLPAGNPSSIFHHNMLSAAALLQVKIDNSFHFLKRVKPPGVMHVSTEQMLLHHWCVKIDNS